MVKQVEWRQLNIIVPIASVLKVVLFSEAPNKKQKEKTELFSLCYGIKGKENKQSLLSIKITNSI